MPATTSSGSIDGGYERIARRCRSLPAPGLVAQAQLRSTWRRDRAAHFLLW